jgi:hypothetical protein
MLPYQMIAGGRFALSVSGSVASNVYVPVNAENPPDFIIARSITGFGRASNASAIEWWWDPSMGNGAANGLLQSSNTLGSAAVTTYQFTSGQNGISFFDTSNPPTFPLLPITTTFINHTTWVVSMSNTGNIQVGDFVRIINPTGMLQAGGITAQVTAVTTNTSITLGYIATAVTAGGNFTADSTGGSIRKFIPSQFYPKEAQVMFISRATQAKVYFARPNSFTVGEGVDFNIPSTYGQGWQNISFLTATSNGPARVLAVTNTASESSITLDFDTSGFPNAFAYPTSAASVGAASPPFCFPAGSLVVPISAANPAPLQPPGTNLVDAFDNRNTRVILFNGGLFSISSFASTNGDVWEWQAYKFDTYSTQTVTLF